MTDSSAALALKTSHPALERDGLNVPEVVVTG